MLDATVQIDNTQHKEHSPALDVRTVGCISVILKLTRTRKQVFEPPKRTRQLSCTYGIKHPDPLHVNMIHVGRWLMCVFTTFAVQDEYINMHECKFMFSENELRNKIIMRDYKASYHEVLQR